jgi:hypothetical protein
MPVPLTLITGIFTVLTIVVGGACTLLLINTKTLRDSRDDQEKRIKFLEEERVRDKDTIASQAAELLVWKRAPADLAVILDIVRHVGASIDRLVSMLEDSQ